MVNPFTLYNKISKIQQEVLDPLYISQNSYKHEWLLAETGRVVDKHKKYIEELCSSRLIATIFKVVKMLGGADRLTVSDFDRFTGYVNEGGLQAMVKMLVSVDKEKSFQEELKRLPRHVQSNAPDMLQKAKLLHKDFINSFFKQSFGDTKTTPQKLQDNFKSTDDFIGKLVQLAAANKDRSLS